MHHTYKVAKMLPHIQKAAKWWATEKHVFKTYTNFTDLKISSSMPITKIRKACQL